MSETIQGTITKLNDVIHSTAKGSGKPYSRRSFQIDGDLVGGFINKDNKEVVEGLQPGDTVQCDVEVNGDYKNFSNLVVLNQAKVHETVQDKPAEVKTNNYQERMNFVGARNTALRFVEIALSEGKLPLSDKGGLEELEAAVELYTNKFAKASWEYEYNKGEEDGAEDRGYAE